MSSSTSSPDTNIDRIFAFWFDDRHAVTRWFIRDDSLDQQIKSDFGGLVAKARTADLDNWCEEPKGSLALIVLLDQFSRNIYRGSLESYSADAKAVDVTTRAIAEGFDKNMPLIQQSFFYLPYMHSESLLGQIAAKGMYEGLALRCSGGDPKARDFANTSVEMAQKHMDVIAEFGRFPARNKALGRESTTEEIAFLKEHPHGFRV